MKKWIISIVMGLGVVAMAQGERPQGDGTGKAGQRQGCPELHEVRQANQQARQEHYEQQRKDAEAFHRSLEDVAPEERWDKIMAFRSGQYRENTAFHSALHEKLVAAIRACESIPQERRQELLSRVGERYGEAVAFHEGIHREVMAFLAEMKASDKTSEEKRDEWQSFRDKIEAKLKAWREEHGPKRGKGGPKRGEGGRGKSGRKHGGAEA